MSEIASDEDVVMVKGGGEEGKSGGLGACGADQCKENRHLRSRGCPGAKRQESPKATPKKLEQSLISNFFGFGRNDAKERVSGSSMGVGKRKKNSPTPSPEQKKRKSDDKKTKSAGKTPDSKNTNRLSTILNFFTAKLSAGNEESGDVNQEFQDKQTNVKEIHNKSVTPVKNKQTKDHCESHKISKNEKVFRTRSKSNKDSSELSESMGSDKNNGNPMGAKRKDADGAIQIQRVSSSEEAQANGVVCDERSKSELKDSDGNKTDAQEIYKGEDSSSQEEDCFSSRESSPSPTPSVPEGEYEVEEIWDYVKRGSRGLYYVKWKGYGEDENTWEPIENLEHCDFLLNFFYNMRREEIQRGGGYVIEGGRRRKLDMPPDPRPFVRKIRAFLDCQSQPTVSEEEIQWALDKIKSGEKFLWPVQKTEKLMFESYEGKLTDVQTSQLRQQLVYRDVEEKRNDQIKQLKMWQKKLNSVTEKRPTIEVENEVDLSLPPSDFQYINDYIATDGIIIPDDPPVGCDCEGGCAIGKDTCCPVKNDTKFAYRSNKRILAAYNSYMIYECNKRCKCGPDCNNRVVQDGVTPLRRHKVCIYRTKHCGWGVKTLKPIPKGTFVCMYVGEILTTAEAERRGKKYDEEGTTYLFDLDFNSTDNPYTVDARYKGNVSHFINHSCDPNLAVYGVWVDCLDVNLPKLALFAERDIAKDEELSFDYKSGSKTNEPDDDVVDGPLIKRLRCMCNSENCRKILFT